MRCDTKRAIWWDLYCHLMRFIQQTYIIYTSTIFRTLQVNKWWSKKQTFFPFCEINATKFGSKIWIHLACIMQFQYWRYIATNVCSRKTATTFGDLPDCAVIDESILIIRRLDSALHTRQRVMIGFVLPVDCWSMFCTLWQSIIKFITALNLLVERGTALGLYCYICATSLVHDS